MTLEQSWLVARLQNENANYAATVARLEADNRRLKEIIEEMFAELLDLYDGYDKTECKAYWKARLL